MAKVRTRKRGRTWSYIFEAGRTESGRRKVVEKGGYATKDEAYLAGTVAYTDWRHGNIGITSEHITVSEFLNSWLKNVATVNVRATTLEHYESMARSWIIPYFQGVTLQELTPAMLDQWMRTLARKGYARKTLQNLYAFFHHALDYAVYPAELIQSNPIIYIKVPRSAPAEVVKRTIISQERFAKLLDRYPFGTTFYIPLLLLYHTGMRRGEVTGLSWESIDFRHNVIALTQQIVYCKKEHFVTLPKTQSSNRRFVIDDFLAGELKKWKEMQAQDKQLKGDSYVCVYADAQGKLSQASKGLAHDVTKVNLVCTQRNGRMVTSSLLGDMLLKEGLNAHSFRHTHATQLIENGATPKGVAGRLGHRNAVITQNLYTHNTDKLQQDTASIFVKIMQTNSKSRQNADKNDGDTPKTED